MSYKIISQFIKDISFEIPDVQTFTLLDKEIKKYNLNFEIKSKKFKDYIVEVNTILRLLPGSDVKNKMLTEINFTALVSIDKGLKDKKELEKIVLVKVPKEIFPDLYDVFIYLFGKAGIKNISIEKEVDFEKLYNERNKN